MGQTDGGRIALFQNARRGGIIKRETGGVLDGYRTSYPLSAKLSHAVSAEDSRVVEKPRARRACTLAPTGKYDKSICAAAAMRSVAIISVTAPLKLRPRGAIYKSGARFTKYLTIYRKIIVSLS